MMEVHDKDQILNQLGKNYKSFQELIKDSFILNKE